MLRLLISGVVRMCFEHRPTLRVWYAHEEHVSTRQKCVPPSNSLAPNKRNAGDVPAFILEQIITDNAQNRPSS